MRKTGEDYAKVVLLVLSNRTPIGQSRLLVKQKRLIKDWSGLH